MHSVHITTLKQKINKPFHYLLYVYKVRHYVCCIQLISNVTSACRVLTSVQLMCVSAFTKCVRRIQEQGKKIKFMHKTTGNYVYVHALLDLLD